MFVDYSQSDNAFSFISDNPRACRGVPHGMTTEGYKYYIEDWYPYNVQKLASLNLSPEQMSPEAQKRYDQITSIPEVIMDQPIVTKYYDKFKKTPYPYQEDVIEHLMHGDRWLCTIEQGMGKTLISYMSVLFHKLENMPYRTLVVCPRIVLTNWLREVRIDTDLVIQQYYGTPQERAGQASWLLSHPDDWDMVVTTFDTIIERNTAPTAELFHQAWNILPQKLRVHYFDVWKAEKLLSEDELDQLAQCTDEASYIPVVGHILRRIPQRFLPEEEIAHVRSIRNSESFLTQLNYDILIIDEASRCLSADSQRSQVIERLARQAKKVFLMSGTLCVGRPTDLHEPCNILSRYVLDMSSSVFNKNFVQYRRGSRFAISGYKNIKQLKQITDPYMIARTREGVKLQLPDRLFSVMRCPMTEQQIDMYDSVIIRDEYEVQGVCLNTASVLQKLNKCQQICNGFVFLDLDKTTYCTGCDRLSNCVVSNITPGSKECGNRAIPKTKPVYVFDTNKEEVFTYFASLRKDADEKFIVWAWFRPDLDRIESILKKLEIKYVTPDDANCTTKFNNDKSILAFVGQEKQGIGITLNAATYTLYWSNGMDLEARLQSMDRNYRIGQKQVTTVVDIIVDRSVEEDIYKALSHKTDVKDFVQNLYICTKCSYSNDCPVYGQGAASAECRYAQDLRSAEHKEILGIPTIRKYSDDHKNWMRLFSDLGSSYGEYIRNKTKPKEKV